MMCHRMSVANWGVLEEHVAEVESEYLQVTSSREVAMEQAGPRFGFGQAPMQQR
jgi:hypothetical protein